MRIALPMSLRNARSRFALLLLAGALAAGAAQAEKALPTHAPKSSHRPMLSGYKFIALGLQPGDLVMASPSSPAHLPLAEDASLLPRNEQPNQEPPAVTWAFATGECGAETIAGQPGERIAAANLPGFEAAGVDFLVSTGGQGGSFTCASDEAMERFLSHYASPRLRGFDFDIEAGQTQAQIDSLLARIARAQRRHPGMRVSFTLATLAAQDASGAGLNALGRHVIERVRALGVQDYLVNLMVMDYGPPAPGNCVVREQDCDMGASAIQAARNLHERQGVPFDHMELTAMLGVNDTPGNRFSLPDAVRLARFAREHGLAGVHYWSMDRDNPCAASVARDDCSGLPEAPRGAFAQAFGLGLRSSEGAP
jgi:chitinase